MSSETFLKKARKSTITYCVVATVIASLSFYGQYSKYVLGHGRLWGFVDFIDVDVEGNFPNWFSSTGLLVCSFLLWKTACGAKDWRIHWKLLAGIFLYLSIDEEAGIHDRISEPLREMIHPTGFFYFAWVIPAAVLLVLFAVFFFKFWTALPLRIRLWMMAAGVVYVGGAFFMEMLGGELHAIRSSSRITYEFIITIEEYMEMIGIGLMGYACALSYADNSASRS